MPKTFHDFNDKETQELLQEAMKEHEPNLANCGVRVDTIFCSKVNKEGVSLPSLSLRGYTCAAYIRINALEERTKNLGDAQITIDSHFWSTMNHARKIALLHHELHHLEISEPVTTHPNGTIESCELDDLGRPKLQLRMHDWELGGFAEIAKKHGENAIEVTEAQRIVREYGSLFQAASAE